MLNVSLSNFIANSPKPSPASCLSIMMTIADAGSYILKSQYLPVTGRSTIFCNTNVECNTQYTVLVPICNAIMQITSAHVVSRIYVSSLVSPRDIMTV